MLYIYFCFDSYFELTYKDVIKYSLEYLKIKDVENYREVFYKYFKQVHDMSEINANRFMTVGVSNRKELEEYWLNNKKKFLQEIIDKYSAGL